MRKVKYLAVDIENKIDQDVTLLFKMEGRQSGFVIPARSRRRQLVRTLGDYMVPFTATTSTNKQMVYLNGVERVLLTPTADVQWKYMVIQAGML